PDGAKRGYRRWVITRLAQYFHSPELARLAQSDLYWDRVVSVEPVGERETYDLDIEGDHNFLANDLVVHNSHASSFALLAYASAWLKVHEPAPFYAALLNNQPMGFYHAATVVTDARRHGLRILPVDADYAGSGVTLGRHPMAARRAALARRGVWRATDLAAGADGARVRVAGSVIVRQRPGTAKGFVFLTLEDETGIANVIVTPGL